jgi:hypothetical protein
MSDSFRLWLEADEDQKKFVFCDLDETLVHSMEVGWLKDSPQNKKYAAMVVPGKQPYPDVFRIHSKGQERYVFPRPGCLQFLKSVSSFAELYLLTHSKREYAEKVCTGLKCDKYIKGIFSTRDVGPGVLGKRFRLDAARWVLVDNLDERSIEIVNKMRILGLGWPDLPPREEAKRIMAEADDHFVDVEDWVPTVEEYDDYELWRALPKIRYKLGIQDLR